MLQSIHIAGFRSIREQTLKLGRVNVLIGPNGAGKSNLVSFFRMLELSMKGNLQLFVGREGGANSLLHNGTKATPAVSFELELPSEHWVERYQASLVPAAQDTLIYSEEVVRSTPRIPQEASRKTRLGPGHKESALPLEADNGIVACRRARNFLANCRTFHFHDTSAEAGIRLKSDPSEGSSLRSRGENLAAFLFRLREERRQALLRSDCGDRAAGRPLLPRF